MYTYRGSILSEDREIDFYLLAGRSPEARRKWDRVAEPEHVRNSPPRGLASEATRSRVPPTVAPESMTAQVGLVLGYQTGESAGCTAAASSSSVGVPCWFRALRALRALRGTASPARLRRRRAVPPPPRYRRAIGRLVLLARVT